MGIGQERHPAGRELFPAQPRPREASQLQGRGRFQGRRRMLSRFPLQRGWALSVHTRSCERAEYGLDSVGPSSAHRPCHLEASLAGGPEGAGAALFSASSRLSRRPSFLVLLPWIPEPAWAFQHTLPLVGRPQHLSSPRAAGEGVFSCGVSSETSRRASERGGGAGGRGRLDRVGALPTRHCVRSTFMVCKQK